VIAVAIPFFNIPTANVPFGSGPSAASAEGGNAAPPPAPGVGVFASPQSVMTFPVATGMVSATWKVLSQVFPSWGGEKWVALAIALFIGSLIFLMSEPAGGTRKDRIAAAGFALLNSFTLAAAALGITEITK
jgi:hypothetical protein